MDAVYKICCGLDVHKRSIVACIINGNKKEIRTFDSLTHGILELVDWIKSNWCEAVAMESTGVYWKPIYNILELENITALVVNAKHMKAVPGRKTDVKDSEWIAELLQHGLLQASFIPGREQRELRELVRYRRSIVQERAREVSRVQKVLEGANIKLSSIASDVFGASGRAMLNSIVEGNVDPVSLAQMAKAKLRGKITELQQALNGMIGEHQRMILKSQLSHIDFLSAQIEDLSKEIVRRLESDNELIELLDTIPGVNRKTAETILAEIGTDMSRFPTASHLSSWVGLCPGNNESAGKKKSSSIRDGNQHLKATLVESVLGARSTKSYFAAQYKRIAARKGSKRATIAVAHSMLIVIYHIISERQEYQDLGADYFDKLNSQYKAKRLITQLTSMGYTVTREEATA